MKNIIENIITVVLCIAILAGVGYVGFQIGVNKGFNEGIKTANDAVEESLYSLDVTGGTRYSTVSFGDGDGLWSISRIK